MRRDVPDVVTLDDGTSVTAGRGDRQRRPVSAATGASLEEFERTSVYYAATQSEAQLCQAIPSWSSGVATRRVRPRCSCPVRSRFSWSSASRTWASRCPGTSSTGSSGSRASTSCSCRGTGAAGRPGAGGRRRGEPSDRRTRTLPARALFVFVGATPCTGWLGELVDLDDRGFVRTGPDAWRPQAGAGWQPLRRWRSWPGIFAVGDVRSGSAKRVGAAVGEGAMVIRLAHGSGRRPRPCSGVYASEETAVPMGFEKFERLFRAAGEVSSTGTTCRRYLDFVNDMLYDLLIIARATAKANARDVIKPRDLPITKGLQESMHAFRGWTRRSSSSPSWMRSLTARPPLDVTLGRDSRPGSRRCSAASASPWPACSGHRRRDQGRPHRGVGTRFADLPPPRLGRLPSRVAQT